MSSGGVLVTGASRGIGRACVDELARRGLHVVAGVRRAEDAEALDRETSGRVTPVLLDVTDTAQVRAAATRVQDLLGGEPLRAVVNNAGTMLSGPLEHVSLDEVRRLLEVNVVGPLTVVQAFLPLLRASNGRIVNIGSTSGRHAGRFVGAYAASKAGMEALTSTLRLELADAGVAVCIVEPGAVATDLWDQDGIAQEEWMAALGPDGRRHYGPRAERRLAKLADVKEGALQPQAVAAVVAEALTSRRPRPRYVVGRRAAVLVAATRALPERALIRLSTRD